MGNSLKVDQKGRLKIPMALLTSRNEPSTDFYITSENGKSVRIYPMRVWTEVEGRLERLCLHSTKNQKVLARVKYFGQAVTMDNQGRLLIPIILRNSARMKGGVVVLDYVNHLEVWNHARLMNNLRSNPITAQDEKTLNEVFSTPRSPWAGDSKNREGHAHEKERRFGVHRRAHRESRSGPTHAIRGARTNLTEHARVA